MSMHAWIGNLRSYIVEPLNWRISSKFEGKWEPRKEKRIWNLDHEQYIIGGIDIYHKICENEVRETYEFLLILNETIYFLQSIA